mmetsp:Transcript_29023/g.32239  ORF Transcript_29023/g.32239 Transcript_29023/m.32239 type:complete len:88 (-) Transcript_29023:1340-1603(-)
MSIKKIFELHIFPPGFFVLSKCNLNSLGIYFKVRLFLGFSPSLAAEALPSASNYSILSRPWFAYTNAQHTFESLVQVLNRIDLVDKT